jgi:hypothetical protein
MNQTHRLIIHDFRGGMGGGGVLSLDPPPEKIISLDPPLPPKKKFCQKGENLAKNAFFEIYLPTLEIFTNLL